MTSAALKQLTELHRSMYKKAHADALESLGDQSQNIKRYAEEFAKSLPDTFTHVKARRITQAIDSHKLIIFGDFHSHKQCQRALLRIVRAYVNTPDHAPVGLALEMFRSDDQPILDAWQEGRISEEELLDKTNYDQIWGFPWANYRPLLEYCKNKSIPLFATNTKNAGKDSLKVRDDHAATILQALSKKYPTKKIFYIVGEYHLADVHLPLSLHNIGYKRAIMRIVVNADKYFFKMPHEKIHRQDEFLELNSSFFCILNSPPWIKWQSQTLADELRRIGSSTYINSEISYDSNHKDLNKSVHESDFESDLDEDDDDFYTEETLDLDTHLRVTIENVASFLNIKDTSQLQDSFKIVTSVDDEDIEHLPNHARAKIFAQASREGVAAEFNRRILFLSELSINNLAFASGLIIFGTLSHLKENYKNHQDLFVVQTLKLTFGYLANKILNPRISLHTKKALEDYIGAIRGKHVIGPIKLRRDVARSAIKFLNWSIDSINKIDGKSFGKKSVPIDILHLDQRSAHDVSRHLAQAITSALYQKMLIGKIDSTDLGRWFSKTCTTPQKATALLIELIRQV